MSMDIKSKIKAEAKSKLAVDKQITLEETEVWYTIVEDLGHLLTCYQEVARKYYAFVNSYIENYQEEKNEELERFLRHLKYLPETLAIAVETNSIASLGELEDFMAWEVTALYENIADQIEAGDNTDLVQRGLLYKVDIILDAIEITEQEGELIVEDPFA